MIVDCPECALPSEVLDRRVMTSTDGPVEFMKIRCINGHNFNGPVSRLTVR